MRIAIPIKSCILCCFACVIGKCTNSNYYNYGKNSKYVFGILAIIIVVGISAFTNNTRKATQYARFYWYGDPQKAYGTSDTGIPACLKGVTAVLLADDCNWDQTANCASIGNGDYLAAIEFELDDTPNDGCDGALTLAEAVQVVADRFTAMSQALPGHDQTIFDFASYCIIKFKRATSCY